MISNNWCLERKVSHITQSHALHTNDGTLDDLSLRVSYCTSEKWESRLHCQSQEHKGRRQHLSLLKSKQYYFKSKILLNAKAIIVRYNLYFLSRNYC